MACTAVLPAPSATFVYCTALCVVRYRTILSCRVVLRTQVPYEDEGSYVVVKHAALVTSTILSQVLQVRVCMCVCVYTCVLSLSLSLSRLSRARKL